MALQNILKMCTIVASSFELFTSHTHIYFFERDAAKSHSPTTYFSKGDKFLGSIIVNWYHLSHNYFKKREGSLNRS